MLALDLIGALVDIADVLAAAWREAREETQARAEARALRRSRCRGRVER
jgi:hypothetical protein